MEYEEIQSIVIIYGKKRHMDKFLNHFHEFFERDGKDLQCLRIKNNPSTHFKDLKTLIYISH